MSPNLKLETAAYRSLADLLEEAEKTRRLFEEARVPLPDALQRLLRSNGHFAGNMPPVPASFRPPAPPEADNDWIWTEWPAETTPGTMALALLRQSNEPLTVRQLHEKLRALGFEVSVGTVANIGTRASEGEVIQRDDEGRWTMAKPESAAIIHEKYVWGRPQVFQAQEIASLRRKAIVHLLRQNTVGLQQSQIVAALRQSQLLPPGVPVNKALMKADMEALEGKQVRRRGNSKKWEAI